ncbi:reverse transcriptase domain-containing protein [Desulforhabdus sp. TSK]|uniref:reverse transcriptase domain-containing protein n=1 Tax=Desulforhabdus sp. TSK TaxID=2925014 RepID=UPI001FC7F1E6|nr:reverse transcriptase domain-containing protein [Desulforhabdus sp. TSK]
MEAVVERENMLQAWKQVKSNKGSAGVNGMDIEATHVHLREHWPRLREELLEGSYQPQPVRKVEIPKPGGKGMRQSGIPTVVDRLIQQVMHQVMQPIFDPDFSESSYGFRPGRGAHQAVKQAREYVSTGRRWALLLPDDTNFDTNCFLIISQAESYPQLSQPSAWETDSWQCSTYQIVFLP